MIIKWTDLRPGDILQISEEAFKTRADEGWTKDPFYITALYIVKKISYDHGDEYVNVHVQDSHEMKREWRARIKVSNGSIPSYPNCPLFEVVSLAEDKNE